ncbi:leu operon leader peptide [Candidatus Symbiopectobacterium sp. NZEC151]|nr:leu operon leader peptide [Candidatus Symbiopectobacterium sp. NZEC151]
MANFTANRIRRDIMFKHTFLLGLLLHASTLRGMPVGESQN